MSGTELNEFEIILASQSPRRREILGRTGLSFAVHPASDREVTEETEPARIVEALAAHKAREVYEKVSRERAEACALSEASPLACGTPPRPLFVIGADTVVVIGGQILGKPESPARAAEMLRLLSGASHEVLTGVCLIAEKPAACERIFHERTRVFFRTLSEEEIASYVATGEPMDKAGAYGIQGRAGIFVDHIEGDYDNVVGFPLTRVLREAEALLAPAAEEPVCERTADCPEESPSVHDQEED